MTTTTRNEAAERLRGAIGDRTILALPGQGHAELGSKVLDRALAAERRATVERIRERIRLNMDAVDILMILDEEAAR